MQRPATAIFTNASVVSWLLSSASYLSKHSKAIHTNHYEHVIVITHEPRSI